MERFLQPLGGDTKADILFIGAQCCMRLAAMSKNGGMLEKVRRLNPTPPTLRWLFAVSGNRCAFPNCDNPAIDDSGDLLAEVCHIEAANVTGERFNHSQSNEDRRQFENLIILCRHHHAVTNNVEEYPVHAMRKLKADHIVKVQVTGTPNVALSERFVDQSQKGNLQLPSNFGQLDISGCEHQFFVEAQTILKAIAHLPALTRSLYANALANSHIGDLYIYCDPFELGLRLKVDPYTLNSQFIVLENQGLMWVPEHSDQWREQPMSGWRSYFRQFDRDDNGIYFLWLMRNRFASEPQVLVDVVENLNFNLLDA